MRDYPAYRQNSPLHHQTTLFDNFRKNCNMQNSVIVMTPEQLEGYIFQAFEKAATRYAPPSPVPMVKSDMEELITRQDVANILKLKSLVSVDNLTKKGLLKKHRLGGVVRFKRGEVVAFSQMKNKKEGK